MTFSTMERIQKRNESRQKPVKVAQALQYLVKEAFLQGRLVCGVLQCAQILNSAPRQVFLCVIQKPTGNCTDTFANRKLLEAYCTEKKVRLVQVDSCRKVASQIQEVPESQREVNIGMENVKDQDRCTTERLAETECLLITKADVTSDNEQFVVTYHDIAVFGRPVPYIAISE